MLEVVVIISREFRVFATSVSDVQAWVGAQKFLQAAKLSVASHGRASRTGSSPRPNAARSLSCSVTT
jgi:hypothetical protein